MTRHDAALLPPEDGWLPEQFPEFLVVPITYTCCFPRPDPHITINREGQLFIDAGPVRLAFLTQTEWLKLTSMVDKMYYAYHDAKTQEDPDDFTGQKDTEDDFTDADRSGQPAGADQSGPGGDGQTAQGL